MQAVKSIFILLSFFTLNAQAAELQWPTTPYSHYSNQEPLSNVLESLSSSQGIPVVVSTKIQDVISISFAELEPAIIFKRLVDAYNLTWYYDGHVLYVYRLDEMQTKTIKLKSLSVKSFKKSLRELDILDERFSFRSIDHQGLIYLSGPKRFLELTAEMANHLDHNDGQPNMTAKVYKWKDKQGITHFSSAPPKRRVRGLRIIRM
jgi:type II secretory pathway component GspD/PulD (secretin)